VGKGETSGLQKKKKKKGLRIKKREKGGGFLVSEKTGKPLRKLIKKGVGEERKKWEEGKDEGKKWAVLESGEYELAS